MHNCHCFPFYPLSGRDSKHSGLCPPGKKHQEQTRSKYLFLPVDEYFVYSCAVHTLKMYFFQINQKVLKSAMLKDLCFEIDRLKQGVSSANAKVNQR